MIAITIIEKANEGYFANLEGEPRADSRSMAEERLDTAVRPGRDLSA